MKNFAFTVLTASLVGGIINSLVSKKSKVKKYVFFLVTIVCTLSLLQPLITVLSSASELKDAVSSFFEGVLIQDKIDSTNDIIINTSKARIENGIKDLVIDKYKFSENEVAVEIILNQDKIDEIKIEKIYVYISGKASWSDSESIERYLSNMVSSEIEVKRR